MPIRLNKFIASNTGLSRRKADESISSGSVTVNGRVAELGQFVKSGDIVKVDGALVSAISKQLILFNKPVGYVCSRNGQGSKTIYDLLPDELHQLKTIGRLDKESSGLLLLTNDGDLANRLSHPRYSKTKVYLIELDKSLQPLNQQMVSDIGVTLDDGLSKLSLERINHQRTKWKVTMSEGRNRQIRRTFDALGYTVKDLHRLSVGNYSIESIPIDQLYLIIDHQE